MSDEINDKRSALALLETIGAAYFDTFNQLNPATAYPKIDATHYFVDTTCFKSGYVSDERAYLEPCLSSVLLTNSNFNGNCIHVHVVVLNNEFGLKGGGQIFARSDNWYVTDDTFALSKVQASDKQAFRDKCHVHLCKDNGYCLYNATAKALNYLKELPAENKMKPVTLYLHHKNGNHYDLYIPKTQTVGTNLLGCVNVENPDTMKLFSNHMLVPSLNSGRYLDLEYYTDVSDPAHNGLVVKFKKVSDEEPYDPSIEYVDNEVVGCKYAGKFVGFHPGFGFDSAYAFLRDHAREFESLLLPQLNTRTQPKTKDTKFMNQEEAVLYIKKLKLRWTMESKLPKAFNFCALTGIEVAKASKRPRVSRPRTQMPTDLKIDLTKLSNDDDLIEKINEFGSDFSFKFSFDTSDRASTMYVVYNSAMPLTLSELEEAKAAFQTCPLFYEWFPIQPVNSNEDEAEDFIRRHVSKEDYREHEPFMIPEKKGLIPLVKLKGKNIIKDCSKEIKDYVDNAESPDWNPEADDTLQHEDARQVSVGDCNFTAFRQTFQSEVAAMTAEVRLAATIKAVDEKHLPLFQAYEDIPEYMKDYMETHFQYGTLTSNDSSAIYKMQYNYDEDVHPFLTLRVEKPKEVYRDKASRFALYKVEARSREALSVLTPRNKKKLSTDDPIYVTWNYQNSKGGYVDSGGAHTSDDDNVLPAVRRIKNNLFLVQQRVPSIPDYCNTIKEDKAFILASKVIDMAKDLDKKLMYYIRCTLDTLGVQEKDGSEEIVLLNVNNLKTLHSSTVQAISDESLFPDYLPHSKDVVGAKDGREYSITQLRIIAYSCAVLVSVWLLRRTGNIFSDNAFEQEMITKYKENATKKGFKVSEFVKEFLLFSFGKVESLALEIDQMNRVFSADYVDSTLKT